MVGRFPPSRPCDLRQLCLTGISTMSSCVVNCPRLLNILAMLGRIARCPELGFIRMEASKWRWWFCCQVQQVSALPITDIIEAANRIESKLPLVGNLLDTRAKYCGPKAATCSMWRRGRVSWIGTAPRPNSGANCAGIGHYSMMSSRWRGPS